MSSGESSEASLRCYKLRSHDGSLKTAMILNLQVLISSGNGTTLSDTPSTVTAAVAVLALMIAAGSYRTARKSLRLSERQERRRHERLDIYLHEAHSHRAAGDSYRFLTCAITVSNSSDNANTILSADLYVTIVGADGAISVVKVRSTGILEGVTTLSDSTPLVFPTRIDQRGAVSGLVAFRLPDDVAGSRRIDQYELVLTDSSHRMESLEISIFRDIIDA